MKYGQIRTARFLSRPNRFIAQCDLDGEAVRVHVKNTGRCRELLIPGAEVILSCENKPGRKTPYDLVAVRKAGLLINMDSQAPNAAALELLRKLFPGAAIFPERVYKDSRFDFYLEAGIRKIFLEVKGVTLEEDGHTRFPDAPTERGRKHLRGLMEAAREGYEAYVLFLIQMSDVKDFSPNWDTDPAFSAALCEAAANHVRILAYDCKVTENSMVPRKPVPVLLHPPSRESSPAVWSL